MVVIAFEHIDGLPGAEMAIAVNGSFCSLLVNIN
ncbi:hypothetical protein CLU94_4099 [Janthinobacterium sp. 13]|nr:hypothetical protein CLU94_4099 [Janthinobacterium sp. 13]